MLFERAVAALESIAASLKEGKVVPGVVAAPAAAAPTETKPAKGKGKTEPAPTSAPAPAAPTPVYGQPAAPVADAPKAPAFPYERLKKAVIDLAQIGPTGRDAAVKLLSDYGVKKADAAPPEKWPEMFEKAVAELTRLTNDESNFA